MKDIKIEQLSLIKEYYKNNSFDYATQTCWHPISEKSQSPININTETCLEMLDEGLLTLDYSTHAVGVIDNGQTLFVKIRGVCQLNGRHFKLRQFHFHFKSEHTINDEYAVMEIHFVHISQSGRIAVLSTLFEVGKENATLSNVLSAVDKMESFDINLNDLIPKNHSYYHYNGSLTTPPLEENVEWYIFKERKTLSLLQLNVFHTYYNDNYRQIQPLNERPILEHRE